MGKLIQGFEAVWYRLELRFVTVKLPFLMAYVDNVIGKIEENARLFVYFVYLFVSVSLSFSGLLTIYCSFDSLVWHNFYWSFYDLHILFEGVKMCRQFSWNWLSCYFLVDGHRAKRLSQCTLPTVKTNPSPTPFSSNMEETFSRYVKLVQLANLGSIPSRCGTSSAKPLGYFTRVCWKVKHLARKALTMRIVPVSLSCSWISI